MWFEGRELKNDHVLVLCGIEDGSELSLFDGTVKPSEHYNVEKLKPKVPHVFGSNSKDKEEKSTSNSKVVKK